MDRIGFVLRWLATLALPYLLVAASVRLLLSHEFLRLEYQRPGFPMDPYGFSTEDRLEYGMHAIDFLFQAGDTGSLATLQIERRQCTPQTADAAYCLLFNSNELRHLQDVKHMVTTMFTMAVVCGIAIAAVMLAARFRPGLQREFRRGLRAGAYLTLITIATLAIVAAAAWNSAFDRFHELFFAAGTWRFPYSDSLIRLYPEQLFVDASLLIGGLSIVAALGMLAIVSLWERRGA